MRNFSTETIAEIETALKLHINYKGIYSGGRYHKILDPLAYWYKGSQSQRLSALLHDYFNFVGVKDLNDAFKRLRKLEKTSK